MALILSLERLLWSGPLLMGLLGSHLYFTVATGGVQRWTVRGIRQSLGRDRGTGGVSSFGALATAMAAAIGTGNIIGVATAVALGGPGAVFWCWLTGALGMATRYAESYLTLRYRRDHAGGPMYVMEDRLGMPGLAKGFSLLGVLAAMGTGALIQSNAIASALPVPPVWAAAGTTLLAAGIILGGAASIAKACEKLVPAMAMVYLLGCLYILWMHRALLPEALRVIVIGALSPQAAGGGFAGGTVLAAARYGVARGLFTNEAGMGTGPMAAAAGPDGDPHLEALASMTGVFWDTVVICAVTGLTVVAAMLSDPEQFVGADPARLCFLAFGQIPGGGTLLTVCLVAFAFSTIVGWCWYGAVCWQYLWGAGSLRWYQTGYLMAVFAGTFGTMELVWSAGSVLAGLMTLPNLLCLWRLRREAVQEIRRESTRNAHKNEI